MGSQAVDPWGDAALQHPRSVTKQQLGLHSISTFVQGDLGACATNKITCTVLLQAPVFSKLPRLPAFVGQFVHTFNLFE